MHRYLNEWNSKKRTNTPSIFMVVHALQSWGQILSMHLMFALWTLASQFYGDNFSSMQFTLEWIFPFWINSLRVYSKVCCFCNTFWSLCLALRLIIIAFSNCCCCCFCCPEIKEQTGFMCFFCVFSKVSIRHWCVRPSSWTSCAGQVLYDNITVESCAIYFFNNATVHWLTCGKKGTIEMSLKQHRIEARKYKKHRTPAAHWGSFIDTDAWKIKRNKGNSPATECIGTKKIIDALFSSTKRTPNKNRFGLIDSKRVNLLLIFSGMFLLFFSLSLFVRQFCLYFDVEPNYDYHFYNT